LVGRGIRFVAPVKGVPIDLTGCSARGLRQCRLKPSGDQRAQPRSGDLSDPRVDLRAVEVGRKRERGTFQRRVVSDCFGLLTSPATTTNPLLRSVMFSAGDARTVSTFSSSVQPATPETSRSMCGSEVGYTATIQSIAIYGMKLHR